MHTLENSCSALFLLFCLIFLRIVLEMATFNGMRGIEIYADIVRV